MGVGYYCSYVWSSRIFRPQLRWVLLGIERTPGKGWGLRKIAKMDKECVYTGRRNGIATRTFLSRIIFQKDLSAAQFRVTSMSGTWYLRLEHGPALCAERGRCPT